MNLMNSCQSYTGHFQDDYWRETQGNNRNGDTKLTTKHILKKYNEP